MCGIVGVNYDSKVDFLDVTNMLKSRGPDNSSIQQIQDSFFGHTRLSILDLAN